MIEKEGAFYGNRGGCPLECGVVRDEGEAMYKGHREKDFAKSLKTLYP